jgi:predicted aspartyl protease
MIATVDTGCVPAMMVPGLLAEQLIKRQLAEPVGKETVVLADGSSTTAGRIVIKSLTVGEYTITNVEAVVALSSNATVLLGIGALNRLAPYKIENGKLVLG